MAILKLKATYRPRFTEKPVPNAVIGLGSEKIGAKSCNRPRLRRSEAKKVARNFKNAIDVGTYRLRLGKSRCQSGYMPWVFGNRGQIGVICLGSTLNRGHIV